MTIPELMAIAVCTVGAAIDLRRYRIPNWLTFTALPAGLAINATLGWIAAGPGGGLDALLAALAGAGVGLLAFGILAATGKVGMGDVKLVAAAGALLGWPLIGPMLVYTILAGGIVALAFAARRRRVGGPMPYGLAIAIGCAWAVAARYLPIGLL